MSKRAKIREGANEYVVGGGWGNRIEWSNRKEFPGEGPFSVTGWKDVRPVVGDVLYADMRGGKRRKFVFSYVEIMLDPPDMFFGKVDYLGEDG